MGWFFTVVLVIVLIVFICKNGNLNTELSVIKHRISVLKKNQRITENDEKFILTGHGGYSQPAPSPAPVKNQAAATYFPAAESVQPVAQPAADEAVPAPAFEEFVMKPVSEQPLPKTEVPHATVQPVQSVFAPAEKKSVSTINIILIVGTLFVVLAGLIFATTTWASLTNSLRSIMILLFTLFFFGASTISEKKFGLKSTGIAFYTLGSIFMPITLTAIGFFGLFGEWFTFTGHGKFMLLSLISFMLMLFSGLGAIKYKVNALSWISLFGLSATALFSAFFMVGDTNAVSAVILAAFSLVVVFADRFIPDSADGKLYILFKNWKIYAMFNALALALVSVFTAGEGVVAFISMLIFCVVFMHARFRTGNDAPVGVTAFLLVFVASMVMLVSPENVNDFTYVSAATVLALFILQITNIYSDSISRVLEYIGYGVMSIAGIIALIGIIDDGGWTMPSLLLLGVIIGNTSYLILRKNRNLRGFFALAVVAFAYGAPSLLLADTTIEASAVAVPIIALLFAAAYFFRSRLRSLTVDIIAFVAIGIEYVIRACGVEAAELDSIPIFVVALAGYLLVSMLVCIAKDYGYVRHVFRTVFAFSTVLLATAYENITGIENGILLWSVAVSVVTVAFVLLARKFAGFSEWKFALFITSCITVLGSSVYYENFAYTVVMSVFCLAPSAVYSALEKNTTLRRAAQWVFVVSTAILPYNLTLSNVDENYAQSYLIWLGIVAVAAVLTAFFRKKHIVVSEMAVPLDIATLAVSAGYAIAALIYAIEGDDGIIAVYGMLVAFVYAVIRMFMKESEPFRIHTALWALFYVSFVLPFYMGVEAEYSWLISGGVAILLSLFCVVKYKILKKTDRFAAHISTSTVIALNFITASSIIAFISDIYDERVIPYALAVLVIALFAYILPVIKKNNRISGIFPAICIIWLVWLTAERLDHYSELVYIAGFAVICAVSLITTRRIWITEENRKLTDWIFIASGVLPLALVSDRNEYIVFVGMLEFVAYTLMYYKRIGKTPFADRVVLSVAGAVCVITYWLQPFFDIPELILAEINLVPVYAYCFWLWCVWKDRRDKVETISFVAAIVGVVILLIGAFISGDVVDSLIILFSVFAMLVVSFIIKKRRWFVLSISLIILITLYMSKDFWGSLAWWIYLLGVGVVLILIAAANELGKQKSSDGSTKREKLRRFMDEWTW